MRRILRFYFICCYSIHKKAMSPNTYFYNGTSFFFSDHSRNTFSDYSRVRDTTKKRILTWPGSHNSAMRCLFASMPAAVRLYNECFKIHQVATDASAQRRVGRRTETTFTRTSGHIHS